MLNSDQNNAKGTGPASVFDILTEAFFLCLRTAAEKNSFEDQVCKLPMDSEKFATFLPVILSLFLIFLLGYQSEDYLPI